MKALREATKVAHDLALQGRTLPMELKYFCYIKKPLFDFLDCIISRNMLNLLPPDYDLGNLRVYCDEPFISTN